MVGIRAKEGGRAQLLDFFRIQHGGHTSRNIHAPKENTCNTGHEGRFLKSSYMYVMMN